MREDGRWAVTGLTVLRVGAALLFMEHGAQKLVGLLGGINGKGAAAPFPSLFGFAGPIELLGGLLLLVGLLTRPAALVMAAEMLVAYLKVHFPRGPWPIRNMGELALLYLVVWLFFALHGPGPVSLDGWLRRRRRGGDPAPGTAAR